MGSKNWISVRLSRYFLGIGSLFFSKFSLLFWHDVRNLYEVLSDRARFFGEKKIGKIFEKILVPKN